MKTSHVFWGTFFIGIGGLVLIGNWTNLNFDWGTAWKFWPLVLVLIGVSILVKNQTGKTIVAGLAAFILALSIYASVNATTNFVKDDFQIVFDDSEVGDLVLDTTYYNVEYSDSIKSAALNFDGGAGSFKLFTSTDKLVDFKVEGTNIEYRIKKKLNDSFSTVNFYMKGNKIKLGENHKNSVDISLNTNPSWDLNFDVGAASVDLDLTPYKVNKLDVDMGAAAFHVKLGDSSAVTNVKIDAGASDIDILVPVGSGCEIRTDAALSSKNFEGFTKIKSDLYRTGNFDSSTKKVYIEIDCGVSSLTVKTY